MLAGCNTHRVATAYRIFLKQWISTAQNNITYHMGLDASGSHVVQNALILNDNARLTYGDLSKQVGSMVTLLHVTFGLSVCCLFLFKLS